MSSSSRGHSAFTLVEALVVAAVLGILASIGYVSVSSLHESTRVEKLHNDVAVINAAVQTYQVNGGHALTLTDYHTFFDPLKKAATAATATKIAGVRGEMVDKRLDVEVGTSGERAFFNATTQRFEVKTTGGTGVVRFILDDALATTDYGTEARDPSVELAVNGWVWNYTDRTPPARPAAPSGPGAGTAAGSDPAADQAEPLSPPTFSPPDGSYPLTDYPQTVSISNPNPGGVSKILYSRNGSPEALYTSPISDVDPASTLTARAVTVDPDHWTNSSNASSAYTADPYQLEVSVTPALPLLTYAQAGGAFPGDPPQTPAPTVATVTNLDSIDPKYVSSIEMRWTYDGSDPLAGNLPPEQIGTSPASIDVSISHWGAQNALPITAAAVAPAPSGGVTFLSGSGSASIGISQTALASPTIDPSSSTLSAEVPVTITAASGGPTAERIYYSLDGINPGDSNGNPVSGTLYTGSFQSGAMTNGVIVATARTYGPSGSTQWFTPSTEIVVTYTAPSTPEGAVVGNAILNGTFVGSLIYARPAAGETMANITFNKNAKITKGNLYLPGTPAVKKSDGTVWLLATDSQFAAHIQGRQFLIDGTEIVPATEPASPRVKDEGDLLVPTNYTLQFNSTSLVEGKVIRQYDSPYLPTVAAAPASTTGGGSTALNGPPSGPISAALYSSVTINTSSVGDVRLLGSATPRASAADAGGFKDLIANNGSAFVLGDPDNPNVPVYYSFENLTLNSGADVKVVGRCIVTFKNSLTINSSSTLGEVAHPEWLQLNFSGAAPSFTANSGSAAYAQVVIPQGTMTFNAGSTFNGSVTAKTLTINSNSIVFSLPPIVPN